MSKAVTLKASDFFIMINIEQNYLKSLFSYKEGRLIWNEDRRANKVKGTLAGYLNPVTKYFLIRINNKGYKASHLIYIYHHGKDVQFIDHIDGDTTNDRIENLRECNLQQNAYNRRAQINTSSQYKGVSFCKKLNKWECSLATNGKQKKIGMFKTEIDAAIAYDKIAKVIQGDFARLNFPLQ